MVSRLISFLTEATTIPLNEPIAAMQPETLKEPILNLF